MFPSYRNQSVEFLCKSTDWFLYDGNIGRKKVKFSQYRSIPKVSLNDFTYGKPTIGRRLVFLYFM